MPDLRVTDLCAPASREDASALFLILQQCASESGVTLRIPPPEPTTCCGRGCNGCVWEGFYSAAAYWREEALLQLQRWNRPAPFPLRPPPGLELDGISGISGLISRL